MPIEVATVICISGVQGGYFGFRSGLNAVTFVTAGFHVCEIEQAGVTVVPDSQNVVEYRADPVVSHCRIAAAHGTCQDSLEPSSPSGQRHGAMHQFQPWIGILQIIEYLQVAIAQGAAIASYGHIHVTKLEYRDLDVLTDTIPE